MFKKNLVAFAVGVAVFIGGMAMQPLNKPSANKLAMQSSSRGVKTLLTGLGFGESPRWHKGRLWFSNWGKQEVVAVDRKGKSKVMVRMPTPPFHFPSTGCPMDACLSSPGRNGFSCVKNTTWTNHNQTGLKICPTDKQRPTDDVSNSPRIEEAHG